MRTVRVKRLHLEWNYQTQRWVCHDLLVEEIDIAEGVTAEDVLSWARVNFPEIPPWEFALDGFVDMWRVNRKLRQQEVNQPWGYEA